ncbi:unnamed protein product [Adineta ricciae]|uniref:LysM domain-containing protein n=1 Tax=Adineta ricciae TaxID=249248 RepID=A0A815MHI2_ADIRI|nr:unnamed protein product [Adineta ricciae]
MQKYTIKAGDTLWALSKQYDIPLDEILTANPDVVPENLQIGQTVNLPTRGKTEKHHHTSSGSGRTISMRVTSYGWNDNDPPSAEIAYPKSGGYPTKHNSATEGRGTYEDPITFATDERELDIGTMIYVPFLRKYFVMEDRCASAVQA